MKKKIIIWVIIIAVIGGFVSLNISRKNKLKYAAVKTVKVTEGDVKSYLSTTTTIKSKNSKDYYGPQGKVKTVNVKVGDSVKKGQVLVNFDVQDLNAQVKTADIQYNNAVLSKQSLINQDNDIVNKMSDLDNQIADYDKQIQDIKNDPKRAQELPGVQAKRDQAKASRDSLKRVSSEQLKQADNQISLSKINQDTAKQNLSKSVDNITAEFDGVVTTINVVQGATATGAQPAVVVQDLENLKAMVSVGKYDAGKIQLGQEAVIKSGGKEYKGKVSFIDPAAKKAVTVSGGDTTLGVEIDILDKAEGLKIDFDADVDILLGQVSNVIKVPAETVRSTKEGKNYIFVVEGEKAVEKEVQLGLQSDMEVQIIEGVKVGDKVISNPSTTITNGALVKEAVGVEKK